MKRGPIPETAYSPTGARSLPCRDHSVPAPALSAFRPNNFDLWRIFAATQVLIFHALARFGLPVPGWLDPLVLLPGVPIFFVISGYLVSASYERQGCRPLAYFKNRALRIFPGLWVCVLLTTAAALFLGFRLARPADFAWLPAQSIGLIYTPPFLSNFGSGTYNGSLWTIPLELQFYLLVPLLYAAVRACRLGNQGFLLALGCFALLAVVLGYLLPDSDHEDRLAKLIRYTFAPQFYCFLLGAALQRLQAFRSRLIAGKGLLWLAFYLLLSFLRPPTAIYSVCGNLILGVTVISLAYTLPGLGEKLLHGQDISYGVYIYHGLLINLFLEAGRGHPLLSFWLLLPLTYLAAILSWRLIEKPSLRWKHARARSSVPAGSLHAIL